jgi:hypothetical protein
MRRNTADQYTLNLTSVLKPLVMLLTTWDDSRLTRQEVEEFDDALTLIHDRALIAEVYRFCQASMAVTQYQHNICNVPTGRLSDLDARGCLSGSTTTKCVTS